MSSQLSGDVTMCRGRRASPELGRERAAHWGIRTSCLHAASRLEALPWRVLSRPQDRPLFLLCLCGASRPGGFQRKEAGLVGTVAPEACWAGEGRRRPAGTRPGLYWARVTCWPSFWSTAMVCTEGPDGRSVAEGRRGSVKDYLWLKDRSLSLSYLRTLCLGMRTRGQMNPDLCNAISKVGSANMGWCKGYDSVILSP